MAVSPGGRPADASPLGKGKGPRRLDDYVRMVAHALMRKNPSWTEGHAIAVARNAIKRFQRKSKNPAVQAGAAKSIANQAALDARHTSLSNFKEIIDMAVLTTKKRDKLPASSFAVPKGKGSHPEKDSYPVNDKAHQRNALTRVAQHGTPAEKRAVLAAVRRKNPALAKRSKLKEMAASALEQGIDLSKPGQRFTHGWVPIGGTGTGAKMGGKRSGPPKLKKTGTDLQRERDRGAMAATATARKNLAPSEADPKIKNAVTMFGSDRSKWAPGALKAAAKLGDENAKTEIARRQRIGTMK